MFSIFEGYKTKIAAVIMAVIGCIELINDQFPLPAQIMVVVAAIMKIAMALGFVGIRAAIDKK